jgi:hypothetical protein
MTADSFDPVGIYFGTRSGQLFGSRDEGRTVRLFDGKDDRRMATVIPFPGYQGNVSIAIGDIDGNGILDLIVGAGKDHAPEVVAAGVRMSKGPFGAELARFQPFVAGMRGGVSVAASQIDGTTLDNIIVGSGHGIPSEVKVYASKLPTSTGAAPAVFSTFKPYPNDTSGVSLSAGIVDFSTGRNSIVTAPGLGSVAQVEVFTFPLLTLIAQGGHAGMQMGAVDQPTKSASFLPFGEQYKGGVSLGTGWLDRLVALNVSSSANLQILAH